MRNSASETITALGGAVAVPSAVRSSESTTTMRVNEVIITRIDGASDSTVRSAISWITRSVSAAALAEIDADVLRERPETQPSQGSVPTTAATVARRTQRRSCDAVKSFLFGRPSKLAISCSRLS